MKEFMKYKNEIKEVTLKGKKIKITRCIFCDKFYAIKSGRTHPHICNKTKNRNKRVVF